MIFTREETEDGIMYVLEIEFTSEPKSAFMVAIAKRDDVHPDEDIYTVEMSEDTVQGLKRLQGAAELPETFSITLQFRDIRPDVHNDMPIKMFSIHLKDLVSSINLVTSGFLDDRCKGVEFPYDQSEPRLILK